MSLVSGGGDFAGRAVRVSLADLKSLSPIEALAMMNHVSMRSGKKLVFVAEKPPPSRVFEQVALTQKLHVGRRNVVKDCETLP